MPRVRPAARRRELARAQRGRAAGLWQRRGRVGGCASTGAWAGCPAAARALCPGPLAAVLARPAALGPAAAATAYHAVGWQRDGDGGEASGGRRRWSQASAGMGRGGCPPTAVALVGGGTTAGGTRRRAATGARRRWHCPSDSATRGGAPRGGRGGLHAGPAVSQHGGEAAAGHGYSAGARHGTVGRARSAGRPERLQHGNG
jgi:hypothetical protein